MLCVSCTTPDRPWKCTRLPETAGQPLPCHVKDCKQHQPVQRPQTRESSNFMFGLQGAPPPPPRDTCTKRSKRWRQQQCWAPLWHTNSSDAWTIIGKMRACQTPPPPKKKHSRLEKHGLGDALPYGNPGIMQENGVPGIYVGQPSPRRMCPQHCLLYHSTTVQDCP